MNDIKLKNTFNYKLIYIFRINDEEHKGTLKIGDATVYTKGEPSELIENCHELNKAAKKRIDSYTSSAGTVYELLHTEIAMYKVNDKKDPRNGKTIYFRDYNVHEVLKRSGIKNKYFDTNKKQNEWFITDLETAKKAIKCVKSGKKALDNKEITYEKNPIIFRPEQRKAIDDTIKCFKTRDRMLWNAKMRFGKTLCALQVAKENMYNKTIIVTHRPVVSEGWYDDFEKIFYDKKDFYFGSKTRGKTIEELINNNHSFVYFASMQDLRGSDIVGGSFDKNDEIFNIEWDFVVVDEAHEGTQTQLGKTVLEKIIKPTTEHQTKTLELSGTPFNLLTDFDENSIFTWDYIMEQEEKNKWYQNNYGDSNPYEDLPEMNIYTYHLEKYLTGFMDVDDKAFNFKEFFRTWTGDVNKDGKHLQDGAKIGEFVHENEIISFLDLITKKDDRNNYPFSTNEYREFFKHTLWILPGVKEARAMSSLLKKHSIFQNFNIINVAGDGDEEVDSRDALKAVKDAIGEDPDLTYTITLSCGRLTTGVSVPEWTAVLMLAGSYSTAASQYLQTIFRVQTPANINGRMKNNCYVFDFAPDRTLKMVAESVQLSSSANKNNTTAEAQLQKFLNFCPVISIDNTGMKEYKVSYLLQELKKAYAERVVKNGFDDNKLYNDELLKLDGIDLEAFEKLKGIIGSSKSNKNVNDVVINSEGFTKEEYEIIEKAKNKPRKELTEEEKEILEKEKEMKNNKQKAISILRGISIRIPLMIYGVDEDIDIDITVDNFCDLIDDLSWKEFMPKGIDKEIFKKFSKYYDKDVFVASSRRIRYISKSADELEPTDRINKIAKLFSSFKNPDKETVLTPWRVVNMHLSKCIGGYSFFDEEFDNEIEEPLYIDRGKISNDIFKENTKILEINSKSGLYPLYLAYSVYRTKCNNTINEMTFDEKINTWDNVVKDNIFVVCKTPMAKSITRRTLVGYRDAKVNTRFFEDLVNQLKQANKTRTFISKVRQGNTYWKINGDDNMKFNAIVGNPPYQIMDGGAQASSTPIYNYFVDVSKKLNPDYISMIIPSRWMTGGKGLDAFRKDMINDKRIEKLFDHFNAKDCFTNVDIKGGVCYFLWSNSYKEKCDITTYTKKETIKSKRYLVDDNDDIYIRDYRCIGIKNKVKSFKEESFEDIVSSRKPYGLAGDLFKDYSKYGLPPLSDKPIKDGIVVIRLNNNNKRVKKYGDEKYPLPKKEMLENYKIFITRNYGSGEMGEMPSTPIIASPNMACTETFIQIGPFETEIEAENCLSYMKTKFFRLLVGIRKNDQGATKSVYRLAPIQDFSKTWTDEELYKKYSLSDEDIKCIEETIEND